MTERNYNNGKWTAAKYNSFIKSGLRSASQRWPPRYEVLFASRRGKRVNPRTGRMAEHHECSRCKRLYVSKDVEVNHIIPVVPVTGFDTWDGVINRLFCEADGLEVVCKPCHLEITANEREERKLNK